MLEPLEESKYCIKCGDRYGKNKLIPIEEGIFTDSYMCRPCANRVAGVFFDGQGSWFKVFHWDNVRGPIDFLMVAPAHFDGSVDEDAWGPVEEHGFDCMGIYGEHAHDPEAVRWMDQINEAFNTEFKLEDFE